MTTDEIFNALTEAYSVYYNIKKEDAISPFDAEADFNLTQEQYIFVKKAKLATIEANEYVYMIREKDLSFERLSELCKLSWEEGLKKPTPSIDHKTSDIILIVIADRILNEAKRKVKSFKNSKSYKFGLWGFSNFKLALIESSTGSFYLNGKGWTLKKTIQHILVSDKC